MGVHASACLLLNTLKRELQRGKPPEVSRVEVGCDFLSFLFFLKTSADKKYWALINPQVILDYENTREFILVDAEMGMMLDSILGTKGHSAYLRPSAGIGVDRPYDVSLEAGYKIIW